jgi:hypothetical protein
MVVKVSKPEINVREKISELDKPSGTAGQAMLAAETPQEQFNLINAGRRRLNINGALNVWQRGTSFSSASTVTYHADRHQSYNSNTATGVATISKSTDAPSGFGSSYKLQVTTADTSVATAAEYGLYHYFEGQDLQGIKKGTPDALPLTFSFWVKSSLTGKFVVELMDNDNSNRHCNKPYYINSANTWEYKTITFPPDTTGVLANDNGNSFHFNFWHGGGTNYSGSSLQENWGALNQSARADGQVNIYGTNGATWQVTGVQLELGKVATPFEHRSYGEELALCQRYFYKHPDSGDYAHPLDMSSGFRSQFVTFPAIMRVAPTLSNVTGSGNYSPANPDSTGGRVHGAYFQWNSVSSSGFVRVDSGFTADAEL